MEMLIQGVGIAFEHLFGKVCWCVFVVTGGIFIEVIRSIWALQLQESLAELVQVSPGLIPGFAAGQSLVDAFEVLPVIVNVGFDGFYPVSTDTFE